MVRRVGFLRARELGRRVALGAAEPDQLVAPLVPPRLVHARALVLRALAHHARGLDVEFREHDGVELGDVLEGLLYDDIAFGAQNPKTALLQHTLNLAQTRLGRIKLGHRKLRFLVDCCGSLGFDFIQGRKVLQEGKVSTILKWD